VSKARLLWELKFSAILVGDPSQAKSVERTIAAFENVTPKIGIDFFPPRRLIYLSTVRI
jgi:hypothetical protein